MRGGLIECHRAATLKQLYRRIDLRLYRHRHAKTQVLTQRVNSRRPIINIQRERFAILLLPGQNNRLHRRFLDEYVE